MPGPSNARKKRKSQGKSQTKKSHEARPRPLLDIVDATSRNPARKQRSDTSPSTSPSPIRLRTPTLQLGEDADGRLRFATHTEAEASINNGRESRVSIVEPQAKLTQLSLGKSSETVYDQGEIRYEHDRSDILLQKPYIHDPGNGPRVRDTRAFLASKYFAQPPALDDPLCAEFAQEEVLQMLKTVLPEEVALILWYNKSRATSRICPACQRLYHVGDVLPDHTELREDNEVADMPTQQSPQMRREQYLSGICSSMCFILASFNQCDPRTTRNAWGHTGDEIDDASWAVLNRPSRVMGSIAKALVMIIRMTRLDDLGLAQLCFPDAVDCEEVENTIQTKLCHG